MKTHTTIPKNSGTLAPPLKAKKPAAKKAPAKKPAATPAPARAKGCQALNVGYSACNCGGPLCGSNITS